MRRACNRVHPGETRIIETSAPAPSVAIEHVGNRCVVAVDGAEAQLTCDPEGDVLIITHTVARFCRRRPRLA